MRNEIWEYSKRPEGNGRIMSLGIVLDIASICYGVFLFLAMGGNDSVEYVLFYGVEAIGSIALGFFNMNQYVLTLILSKTISYRLTDNGIRFEWGLLRNDSYFLNYELIKTMTFLEGTNNTGSILFHLEEHSYFKGYDWVNHVLRTMPSIENIDKARETFDLIFQEWEDKTEGYDNEGMDVRVLDVQINEGEEIKRRLFNRNIGRVYGFILIISLLFFVDNVFLTDFVVNDKVEGISTRMYTEKGYDFKRIANIKKGSKVKLLVTPVYNNVKKVVWRDEGIPVEKRFGFWGPAMFFYFLTAVMLIISIVAIFTKDGNVDISIEPTLVIGPSAILFISLLFYYSTN